MKLSATRDPAIDKDEEEIRALVATWMAATKAGDYQTVLGLMTEEVVFLVPGQPPMIGKAAFAAAAKPQPGQAAPRFDGASEIQEITVLADWAYMWTRLAVTTTMPDGKTAKRAGHTLSILRKENGKWLLARDANLLAEVK
jgi:uncharacterized protein (TIGR02246 family)